MNKWYIHNSNNIIFLVNVITKKNILINDKGDYILSLYIKVGSKD